MMVPDHEEDTETEEADGVGGPEEMDDEETPTTVATTIGPEMDETDEVGVCAAGGLTYLELSAEATLRPKDSQPAIDKWITYE